MSAAVVVERDSNDPLRPDDGTSAWLTPGGLVTVTAPSGVSPYYRLFWSPRQQTSGGRTFEKAWRKALKREADLLRGATPKSSLPLSDGIDYWLDPSRPTPKGGWGSSQRRSMKSYARRYFRPALAKKRSMDLTRADIQAVVNTAPTHSEGQKLRKAAVSLVGALRQGEYLLDNQVIDLSTVWWHGVRDSAAEAAKTDEEKGGFVPRSARPSHDQVKALRECAARTGRGGGVWWRGLMVEAAAYAGPRWSELIALDANSIHPTKRIIDVLQRFDFPTGAPRGLVAPKMAKSRQTFFPRVSPTGYHLEDALRRRAAEALAEQAAGTNPMALLFPSSAGTSLMPGNFHRDIFEKAALAAGWQYQDVERPYGGGTRIEREWAHTWHSLRHTFCTVALEEWGLKESTVASAAGHSSPDTTRRLYVSQADDAMDEALAHLDSLGAPEDA